MLFLLKHADKRAFDTVVNPNRTKQQKGGNIRLDCHGAKRVANPVGQKKCVGMIFCVYIFVRELACEMLRRPIV